MANEKPLIIVPTFNEVENIQPLLASIFAALPSATVMFVDDNSVDGTREAIHLAKNQYRERINIIERDGKLGLGTAYIAGFRWALERDFGPIIEMDADLSHDASKLPEMLEWLKTCDVVVGSRYIHGGGTKNWGMLRKLISRGGSLYSRMVLGLTIRDLTGGFNAWSRRVVEAFALDDIKSEGYSFQIELKCRATALGFRIRELPIVFVDRRAGQSKMSLGIVLEAIVRVWALRTVAHPRHEALGSTPRT